jgi:hypothetical protein
MEIIEANLENKWDSALIELYGECVSRNVLPQMKSEAWLKQHRKVRCSKRWANCALGNRFGESEVTSKPVSPLNRPGLPISLAQLLETLTR